MRPRPDAMKPRSRPRPQRVRRPHGPRGLNITEWRTGRLKSKKTDMLRSIGKQSGESVEPVRKKKKGRLW